jgi:GTP-binding protein
VKFVDSCQVKVMAGRGGNGCVAFRRERFIPHGGPSGGDGGKGGDIVFETDPGLSTLLDLAYAHTLIAKHGENGRGKDQYGAAGPDMIVRMPVGTQVYDIESNELLFDLDAPNVRTVIAKGGHGGRGNIKFASSYDRAPRRADDGEPGEERKLRLELKVMADVGLLGFPNVGKSTFISAVSRARPKIAEYPFTTLTPHLGVVSVGEEASFVLADIPGLIPGASQGAGLGIRFLKHVERTRALLHLVTLDPGEGREPMADYVALMKELARFDPELAKRPQIVAMSKADLPDVRAAYAKLAPKMKKKKIELRLVSAATGEGVKELLAALYHLVHAEKDDLLGDEAPAARARPAAKRASSLVRAHTHMRDTRRGDKPPSTDASSGKATKGETKKLAAAKAKSKSTKSKRKNEQQERRADAKKTAPRARRGR